MSEKTSESPLELNRSLLKKSSCKKSGKVRYLNKVLPKLGRPNNKKSASVNVEKGALQCKLCNIEFDKANDYKKHEREVHVNEKLYKCNQCDAAFNIAVSIQFWSPSIIFKGTQSTTNVPLTTLLTSVCD